MAGRWRDPAAFRADRTAAPGVRPSRRQSIALLCALVLTAGALATASYLIRPDKARAFDLFHGSLFLADSLAPVAVDLASGKPTVRLIDANTQVGAKNASDLAVAPLDGDTLLLNRTTGEFNLVDATGFVVKNGGGVPLPKRAGSTGAVGIASGALAYIEQTGSTGTSVYLVGPTTVQSALNVHAKVKPRAFRSMTEPVSTAPGAAASASNDLWLLAGTGGQRTIRQLSLPDNSSAGATLTAVDRGTVDGAAAIGTATLGDDGSGASAVGVASADRIRVFRSGSSLATVRYPARQGVDSILPASNGQGRMAFLIHGADGWSAVSVGADGSGLRGPTSLTGITPAARLVAPAASRGDLYTMDMVGGQIIRVDGAGKASSVAGAGTYPLVAQNGRVVEPGGFDDAYAIARGSRVIFDSPGHLDALVLFTDGSRDPLGIEKSSAVPVSASGGAEALTKSRASDNPAGKPPKESGTKPKRQPVDPVNNKINCKTATQKPHIPTIGQPIPGSRSVLLQWGYPLLDPQDCEPSTYVLTVKLLSNAAPSPPATLTVQGQKSVNLTKLFPSTQYEITVTAYINGQGTASDPVRVTTGPEGPAAPKNVHVSTDSAGNWNLTWASCGGVQQSCVPSSTWKVISEFCDGRGLSGAPAPLSVTADPTAVQQGPAQLTGGDNLLGRGVRFQVEGIGEQGTVGTPSANTPCTVSWSPSIKQALTLTASQPATTTLGGSAATTVSLDLGANPVRDVGGVGAKTTFKLTGPNGFSKTQGPMTYNGSGSSVSVRFDGVQAGGRYEATATVSPPGHESSVAVLGPQQVTTSADWPTISLAPQCVSGGGLIRLTCDLMVNIRGLSSSDANGERFDVVDANGVNSQIRCGGGPATSLDRSSIDPAHDALSANNLPLLLYSGSCTVTVVLQESAGGPSPKVFGGAPHALPPVTFTVGQPTTYVADQRDFAAAWDANITTSSRVIVKSTGMSQYSDAEIAQLTDGWQETIMAPNGQECGPGSQQPTRDGLAVTADDQCVRQSGTQSGWTLRLSYDDRGTNNRHELRYALAGTPPGFQLCAPAGFQAAWGATVQAGVTVTYGGDQALLAGCSNFRYLLQDQNHRKCGTPDRAPNPPAASVIGVSGGCTPAPAWSVHVSWTDTTGTAQAADILVAGIPPPP